MAKPKPTVMPVRPPRYWPNSISRSVSATSKQVVRKTLMVFLSFGAAPTARKVGPSILRGESHQNSLEPTPLLTRLDTRCGHRLFRRLPLEAHGVLLAIAVDDHVVAREHFAFQDLQG